MKRTAWTLTFAAAAIAMAATTASAQSLKAEIPFPFSAGGAKMQAGAYSVKMNTSPQMVEIYGVDTHRSALAIPQWSERPVGARSVQAILSFACTEGRCVLASIRDSAANVYSFPAGKKTSETHMATVILKSDRAE